MLLFEISGMTVRRGILSAGKARHPVALSVSEESLRVRASSSWALFVPFRLRLNNKQSAE